MWASAINFSEGGLVMSKEVVLTREQVREELEEMQIRNARGRLKVAATATGVMATIKVGTMLAPKAIAVVKFIGGSSMFMDLLVPNYLLILIVIGGGVAISNKAKAEKEKAKQERLKNMSITDLMHLEDEDD